MKKTLASIISIVLLVIICLTNSCSSEAIMATEMPYSPVDLTLDISPMPKLGETVEVTFTVEVKDLWDSLWMGQTVDTISNAIASINFFWTDIHGSYSDAKKRIQIPHEDVFVDGKLNWEGNALENREITLHSQIQLPKEGVWQIRATFSGQDWTSMPSFTKYIAVADGEAVNMLGGDLESSKLAYIDYFSYGGGGQKILDEERAPVILELDIANAPLTGEEALLTCRITSLHDVSDFFTHISLFMRHEIKDIPLSSFLINGSLEWQGDLKQMTPVEFSAVIKFPEEGEWHIFAEGNSLSREEMELSGFVDNITLTITDDKSYYGWKPIDIQSFNFSGDDIPGINPFSDERPTFVPEISGFSVWKLVIGVVVFLVVVFVSYRLLKKRRNIKNNMNTN